MSEKYDPSVEVTLQRHYIKAISYNTAVFYHILCSPALVAFTVTTKSHIYSLDKQQKTKILLNDYFHKRKKFKNHERTFNDDGQLEK